MNKVLMIGGPTGIGKSALAVLLAKRYNGVVISADSMQIYKGMDIGTGKITEDEKQGIHHTMIDIVRPDEEYSVQNYCRDAKKCIDEALNENRLPIVVGGTGLYLNAIINEQNFATAEPDVFIREKYYKISAEKGAEYLHKLLESVDVESANSISVNDIKRTVRALEIYETTGRKKSDAVQSKKSDYDIKFYVLEKERESLYEKINRRVDGMMKDGFVDEVIKLKPYWKCRSMQAIGYKEIIDALESDSNPFTVTESIKQNTRRYAKRQMTFLRWIKSEKTYVQEDFYNNIVISSDKWINEV